MDEPCSALYLIATARIEDLMIELRDDYTIVIVTHNMQQAARVADRTAFFTAEAAEGAGDRTGHLVEFAETAKIFSSPSDPRTEDYISGRFGDRPNVHGGEVPPAASTTQSPFAPVDPPHQCA